MPTRNWDPGSKGPYWRNIQGQWWWISPPIRPYFQGGIAWNMEKKTPPPTVFGKWHSWNPRPYPWSLQSRLANLKSSQISVNFMSHQPKMSMKRSCLPDPGTTRVTSRFPNQYQPLAPSCRSKLWSLLALDHLPEIRGTYLKNPLPCQEDLKTSQKIRKQDSWDCNDCTSSLNKNLYSLMGFGNHPQGLPSLNQGIRFFSPTSSSFFSVFMTELHICSTGGFFSNHFAPTNQSTVPTPNVAFLQCRLWLGFWSRQDL